MTVDPEQIRAEVGALLAGIPDLATTGTGADNAADPGADTGISVAELEALAHRLSQAHDVLLRALESAEKG